MRVRACVAAAALVAGGLVAGAQPAYAACQAKQAVSSVPRWADNCTVSTTANTRSNLVVSIQYIMFWKGYQISHFDGIYGPETLGAVASYQTRRGITPNGVVGRSTWNALAAELEAGTETTGAYYFRLRGGGPELWRIRRSGVNAGWWEVTEHEGCGTGGDGYAWMDSTRDCG